MKSRGHLWLIYALCFILVNALVFLIPFEKTTGVFIAWAGLVIMFLIGAAMMARALGRKSDAASAQLIGRRQLRCIACLLVLHVAALAAVAALGSRVPLWAAAALEAVLLIAGLIALLRIDGDRSAVRQAEKHMQTATDTVKALRAKADTLAQRGGSAEAQKALKALAEELRYSDPVSTSASRPLEERIETLLASIADQDDSPERTELIRRATALVKERSVLVKSNKK